MGGIIEASVVACSCVVIIFGSIVIYKRCLHRKKKKEEADIAEEEMRAINYEFNTREGSCGLTWEFTLTPAVLGKVQIIDRVNVTFLNQCCLQTEAPLLPISHLNYFEILIEQLDPSTSISVGLAPKDSIAVSIPGVQPGSAGINCSTGKVEISGKVKPRKAFRQAVTGDVIGCFFNPFKRQLFFTLNGVAFPEHKFKSAFLRLYPTVYADGFCKIQYNFGFAEFVYRWANQYHYGIASTSPLDTTPPEYPAIYPPELYPNQSHETNSTHRFSNHSSITMPTVTPAPAYEIHPPQ